MRKVIKIKNSLFLLDLHENVGIQTTNHIKKAKDISNWNPQQVGFIIENLRKVGYPEAVVVETK